MAVGVDVARREAVAQLRMAGVRAAWVLPDQPALPIQGAVVVQAGLLLVSVAAPVWSSLDTLTRYLRRQASLVLTQILAIPVIGVTDGPQVLAQSLFKVVTWKRYL